MKKVYSYIRCSEKPSSNKATSIEKLNQEFHRYVTNRYWPQLIRLENKRRQQRASKKQQQFQIFNFIKDKDKNNMTNAYIYARCATIDQSEETTTPKSIKQQFSRCKKYAKEHHYRITGTFKDIATSGNTFFRHGLGELYQSCIYNNINHVLVTNYDRVARDIVTYHYLKRLFEKSSIKFIAVDNPSERFFTIDLLSIQQVKVIISLCVTRNKNIYKLISKEKYEKVPNIHTHTKSMPR